MKRLLYIILFCFFSGFATHAQSIDNSIELKSSFKGNWFVSVGGGAQMYFGDHDRQAQFGERLSPAVDISVGKWLLPYLGARLSFSGLGAKGLTSELFPSHSTGEQHSYYQWPSYLCFQKFSLLNVHADIMFDANTIVAGYREERIWHLIPHVGVGYAYVLTPPSAGSFTINGGIMNSFSIAKFLDINLDIRGMAAFDELDGEVGGRGLEGMLTASLGVGFKF